METNRHPVDELSDVRAEMKRLKEREETLRDVILGGECGMTGDQFVASVTSAEQRRFDADAAKKLLGPEQALALTKIVAVRTIRLSERLVPEDA